MTTGATPQERLAWLKANQPNNWEAIAALERRLGVHGTKEHRNRPDKGNSLDTDFYTHLKALHAKTGKTVYQCCKRLGLQTGPWQQMDEAERMVIRLTKEGFILWNGCEPVFK